jgi:nucleoside-diphosphate-sugar epimerase
MKRVLVLGGTVFVGKHTVQAFQRAGWAVTVLNRGRTPGDLPDGVDRLVADRTDPEQLRSALAGTDWDAVVDVSGFVMVAGSVGDAVGPLLDLFDGHVGSYVFVSSIMAYQPTGIMPWHEDGAVRPDPPTTYGGFKVAVEREVLRRHAEHGFPGCAVRPAAIYGPDNNIFDMETPMFLRLLQGRPVLLPHEGLVTASYGHVDDLCEAITVLAEHPGAPGRIVNVTTEGITTREYVLTLAEIVGAEADIVEIPKAVLDALPPAPPVFGHLFSDRHHGVLSTALAESLGIRPRYDFRSGHEDTYRWFREQGWHELDGTLQDPVWRASWDFAAEAALAARLRG